MKAAFKARLLVSKTWGKFHYFWVVLLASENRLPGVQASDQLSQDLCIFFSLCSQKPNGPMAQCRVAAYICHKIRLKKKKKVGGSIHMLCMSLALARENKCFQRDPHLIQRGRPLTLLQRRRASIEDWPLWSPSSRRFVCGCFPLLLTYK